MCHINVVFKKVITVFQTRPLLFHVISVFKLSGLGGRISIYIFAFKMPESLDVFMLIKVIF